VQGKRKPYITPQLSQYKSVEELPAKFRGLASEILASEPVLKVVVDDERRYRSVSEEFARMLGYTATELVGIRVDDITASDAVDIEFAFRVSRRFGEMRGLWLFRSRDGRKLLCRYHAVRTRSEFVAELKPVLVAEKDSSAA
jgi:PAS domain S-box-containing protein